MHSCEGCCCGMPPVCPCELHREGEEDETITFTLLLCMVGVSKHQKSKRRLEVMDDLVGGIFLVSLGEIKAGRGRFVKAFEDEEKENVFQDSHFPLFHRYLLILPPAFNLQVKKGSECSQIFLPRAECCSGIMQREMHTQNKNLPIQSCAALTST